MSGYHRGSRGAPRPFSRQTASRRRAARAACLLSRSSGGPPSRRGKRPLRGGTGLRLLNGLVRGRRVLPRESVRRAVRRRSLRLLGRPEGLERCRGVQKRAAWLVCVDTLANVELDTKQAYSACREGLDLRAPLTNALCKQSLLHTSAAANACGVSASPTCSQIIPQLAPAKRRRRNRIRGRGPHAITATGTG